MIEDEQREDTMSLPQNPMGSLKSPQKRGKDDFWEALSCNYHYLMDQQLITTCREADVELSCAQDEGMSSLDSSLTPSSSSLLPLHLLPSFVQGGVCLTHHQLFRRTDEVKMWLEEIKARINAEQDEDKLKQIRRWALCELHTYNDCKDRLLREGHIISSMVVGEMRAEVGRRMNVLHEEWSSMVTKLSEFSENQGDSDKLFQDVTTDMRCLRRWLRDVELRLPSVKSVPSYWTLHDLKTKLENQKILQKEIESKGNLVKSLLNRCDQLHHIRQLTAPQPCPPPQATPAPSTTPGHRPPPGGICLDVTRLSRIVANLEKRWHSLWLRSLEWQCLVEQLLGKQEAQRVATSVSSSDTWDGPLTKYPRLDPSLSSCNAIKPMEVSIETRAPSNGSQPQRCNKPFQDTSNDKTQLLSRPERPTMVGATAITNVKTNRPPSGSFEVVQDVGYSSESSTHLSTEDKSEIIRIYSYTPESNSPESPEIPSRDSGLSGGGSPRKYPLSSKCSPIEDTLKEVIDEEYIASTGMRISGGPASDFYTISCTTGLPDSDCENAKNAKEDPDKTLTPEKDDSLLSGKDASHSVTIDNQVVQLRRKPASRLFAPLEFGSTSNKASRVQEWLQNCETRPAQKQIPEHEEEAVAQDSCDASGENTNDSESEPEEAQLKAASTANIQAGSVETVVATPNTENSETPSKVNLRNSKKRRSRDRPWSVTEMNGQLQIGQMSHGLARPGGAPLAMSTSLSALNDASPGERRRLSRTSKAKGSANSASDSEHSETGTNRRNSSTTSLVNLCEVPVQKEKVSPLRRRRLGSRTSKGANAPKNGYSSANDNQQDGLASDQVASDSEKKAMADQGSVVSSSDPMWDDYQEPLYYSENYSEKEMDEDTVKRLLNFGDDYRSFIGSTSDTSSLCGLRSKGRKKVPTENQNVDNKDEVRSGQESEPEEDVDQMLSRSKKHFVFVSNAVKRYLMSKDAMTSDQFNQMVATCQSNIQCLQIIKIHISIGTDNTEQLRHLMEKWQKLLMDIQARGNTLNEDNVHQGAFNRKLLHQEETVKEDIVKLQDEMQQLKDMQKEYDCVDGGSEGEAVYFERLDERIAILKRILSSLHELKSSLLAVKVKVHRLAAGNDNPDHSLTQSVRDLYNTWEDLYERTGQQLSDLQQSRNILKERRQRPQVSQCEPAAEKTLDINEIIRITQQISDGELIRASVTDLAEPMALCEDEYDSNYESGEEEREGKSIWRIFKAALPFQVALVMLYCVAYFMEPHCCDVANTLQHSFGPQLRYEQGPPPV